MGTILKKDYILSDGESGRYKIIDVIGIGSSSVVYDAEYSKEGSNQKLFVL